MRSSRGRMSCGAWGFAPTPTPARTPRGPESWERRASGCAGPSTCTSAPTAMSSSARCSSPDSWHVARRSGDSSLEGGASQDFAQALKRLGEFQRGDFVEIFRAMRGLPVTIRLLDPPIHEFIDVASFERELDEIERQRRR